MTTLKDFLGPHTLELAGRIIDHPIDGNASSFLWGMDGNIYIAHEDPDDGYRSHLDFIDEFNRPYPSDKFGSAYESCLNIKVVGKWKGHSEIGGCEIIEFVDKSGHVWLEVGTDNVNDYYPFFVATWYPKE